MNPDVDPPGEEGAGTTRVRRPIDPDVAPYRIVRRVGAGGMGEVFLAEDDRLGRQVAIKRLHPDRQLDGTGRERLRREARFVAKLNHPAIVQIHDVLERDGTDYVVLEWVEGENLRQRLERDGPLPVPNAIDLARQIAAGLAEAHQQGIVHRDLKAENILVTSLGRAKITDFGIAKQLPGQTLGNITGPAEDALTREAVVIGTYRAMSPEQAVGGAVDPRSDLFSFGVLLYEALTGCSPFKGSNALETLRRVVEHTPDDIRAKRPDIPPVLAGLIHQMLAKEPSLRPRSAREIERTLTELATLDGTLTATPTARPEPNLEIGERQARERRGWRSWGSRRGTVIAVAILVLVGTAVNMTWRGTAWRGTTPISPDPPLYVAAMVPEVRTSHDQAVSENEREIFADAVRGAVVRGLIGLEGIAPKATSEVDRTTGTPLEIARRVAADEIVTSSVVLDADLSRVTLARVQATDGVVLWTSSIDAPTEDLVLLMRTVAAQVRGAYPHLAVRPGVAPGLDVRAEDLREFLLLERRFHRREDPTGESILKALSKLRETSPRFLDADLLASQVALHRFHDSRDLDHLARARHAIERAEIVAPDDPRTLWQRFEFERRAGDPERAATTLARLAQALPGDVRILDLDARLKQSQGDSMAALARLSEAVQRRPSLLRLINLARLELDLGHVDAAREHLLQADRRAPDSFETLSLLAQLELGSGDPAEAALLYQRLVDRSPGTSEISNLGLAYLLLNDFPSALAQFERAYSIEPRNPFFALNLADALFLSGDRETARQHYRDVVDWTRADPAADEAQLRTVQAQALAHLDLDREAIEVLQGALQKAPGSASVAYEAALVYAVIGERTSALVHAEAALARGFDRRWFAFPWFDALRSEPAFAARLEP